VGTPHPGWEKLRLGGPVILLVDIQPGAYAYSGRMSIRKRADREHSAHLQGTLDLLLLRTLIFGPEHGQGIARAIRSQSDDVLIVDHGSLYPALQRLEDRWFIEAEWGTSDTNRKARFYRLTPKGRKELVHEEGEWRRIAAAIMRVLGRDRSAG
jgi:PadR family transcriptional regulator PadR